MWKFIVGILLFLFFNLNVDAQYNVNILSENANIKTFRTKDSATIDTKLNKFLAKKQSAGFVAASFDSVVYKNNDVFAYFFQGECFFWKNIEYCVADSIPFKRKKYKNKKLNFSNIENDIADIISEFENTGFPFVAVNLDSFEVEQNFMSAKIVINLGNLITYNQIFFDPKVRASANFFRNYLNFKKGKAYNEKEIRQIKSRLTALPFISLNEKPQIEFHKNNADLYLYLKNQKANQLSGIVGFSNVNQKLQLTGQADIRLINLLKNADIIEIKWQKNDTKTQNLNFNLQLPYIFSTSLGVKNNFFLEKIDTSYVDVADKLSFSYYFSGFNNVSVFGDFKKSIVFDSTLRQNDFNYSMYGISTEFQIIDNFFNPTRGYYLKFSLATGRKKSETSSVLFENMSELGFYLPLFGKFVLHSRGIFYLIEDDKMLDNQMFKFGGATFMRGFDERSLLAHKIYFSSVEVKYLFDKMSNVFLFVDYSIFNDNSLIYASKNRALGFGIGLNIATSGSIFSLSYAMGKNKNIPLLLKNSKIHFGVKTLF